MLFERGGGVEGLAALAVVVALPLVPLHVHVVRAARHESAVTLRALVSGAMEGGRYRSYDIKRNVSVRPDGYHRSVRILS